MMIPRLLKLRQRSEKKLAEGSVNMQDLVKTAVERSVMAVVRRRARLSIYVDLYMLIFNPRVSFRRVAPWYGGKTNAIQNC
jgi:hypothetical protein